MVFLASDEAGYVTGETVVNGGVRLPLIAGVTAATSVRVDRCG